jgi:hypothetical protein
MTLSLHQKRTRATLFASAVVVLSLACSQQPDEVETLEDVSEQPRALTGQQVTAEGRVNRVFGDCAYELEDAEPLHKDRLLTLCEPAGPAEAPPEAPAGVQVGDWLRVTGVAGEMTRDNYEFKTMLTLPDEVFGERETRPVILVEKAVKIPPPDGQQDEARAPNEN